MEISTKQILKILYVLSWIIFVGVCVEAGGFIFNTFYTLVINNVDAKHFWLGIDLSSLYRYDPGYFFVEASPDDHRCSYEVIDILPDRKSAAR